jgi:hypothetical protein
MFKPIDALMRITAAVFGGYVFTLGCAVFGITGLVSLGIAYDQARVSLMLIAFLIFLCAFLWSFAAKNLALLFAVLFGGGAVMTVMAMWLQRGIVG